MGFWVELLKGVSLPISEDKIYMQVAYKILPSD